MKKPVKTKKKAVNKYEKIVLPKLEIIEAWARNGVIDKDIAINLGVAYSTFREYVKKYSALSSALKHAKEETDLIVEGALFKKAVGHKVIVRKAFKLKKETICPFTKKILINEEISYAEDEIYQPPDTTAIIFFLKNRKPETWVDVNRNINVEMNIEEFLNSKGDDFEY